MEKVFMLGESLAARVKSAPLALAGDEFVDLLEEEADHSDDDFDFVCHVSLG
jgi:hypothetical protein